ncbi:MAG TPA: hypothetical protein VHU88_08320 [Sporichthyaceae bacterium]|nr:hypothetical protein [Sporichthyaceae bacterium]
MTGLHRAPRARRGMIRGSALVAVVGLSAVVAAPVAAQNTFVPGTGTASAGVARIELRSSGAAIGVGLGVARSHFAGMQGNAEAAGVDLGLLDTMSKTPLACGYSPGTMLPPGSVPSRVVVSSGDGASEKRTASVGAGTPLQFGTQYGAAAPDSSATAAVDGMSFDLPGLIHLVGGTASSAAKLVPGSQRQSDAASALSELSLAGGLVRLGGLNWTADHRSGAQSQATAGFSVASVSVGGQPLPTGDPMQLQAAMDAANTALASTGLSLNLPAVTRSATALAVSPLRLSVAATPAVRAALGATLVAIQPLRTQLLTLVKPFQMNPDCGLAKAVGFGYLLVDLVSLALGDDGAVDLDLGGARAGTDGTAYADPFASGFGLIHPTGTSPLPAAASPVAQPVAGAAPTAVVPEGAVPVATQPAARPVALAPTALSCRSTHAGGGCTTTHGKLAAWLLVCLIALLAAADRIRARFT